MRHICVLGTLNWLQTEVTGQTMLPDSRLSPHPHQDTLCCLPKTCSPNSIAPCLPMAGTCWSSKPFSVPPYFQVYFIFHLSGTSPSLPGPLVSSVFEAVTAWATHPPQGSLVTGGQGMLCLGWDSRWIVCAVNFPHCHEAGAVIARGNINNNFPCTFLCHCQPGVPRWHKHSIHLFSVWSWNVP